MANVDDKIAAQGFTVTTRKNFGEVRSLGHQAAERSAGVVTKVTERAAVDGQRIAYSVKRLGAFTVLDFDLHYTRSEDGGGTVTLRVGEYVTSQPTVLGFVPVGPKDAVGFGPLRIFSTTIRQLLA